MAATQWATIEDVATLTGITVDAFTRTLAAQGIELATGLIEEVERTDISDRDRYWLKLATCYQAAWVAEQPDYLERSDVSAASQDGQSATGNPDWLVLSPLARRAVKKVSWKSRKTINIGPIAPPRVDPLGEVADNSLPWRPL